MTPQELKRLAIQIAAQLPEREEDAIEVLRFAKELVTRFLNENVGASAQRS